MEDFIGIDGNSYQAGGYIGVSTGRNCFGSACISGSWGTSRKAINFQHKQYPGVYNIQSDDEAIPINGARINFPDYEPTTESQSELNAQKQVFENRLNALLQEHNDLSEELHWKSVSCELLCRDPLVSFELCYNNCMNENAGDLISEYEANLQEIEEWNNDFAEYVGGIGEQMIQNCIPCDQIKDFLIDQFGDVLKSNFMSLCEEIAEEATHCQDTRIETDCCILVCCYPDQYKMIGE